MLHEEVLRLLLADMQQISIVLAQHGFLFVRERSRQQFTAEELAVDEATAQRGEHHILHRHPHFDGRKHVGVVQQRVLFQREVIGGNMVVEEIVKCRRAKELFALLREFFRACEYLYQMLFGSHGGLVQINLPVHQPPCHEELLHRVDTFLLNHQSVVHHVQHLQQSLARHAPFLHARKE